MTTDKQQINNRLAALIRGKREQMGWTTYRLSKAAGIHIGHVYRIESGQNTPQVDTLIKICEALCLQIKFPDLTVV